MEFGLSFYLIAALIVFLTGISKAGFGAGVEMMAVPVMALFISPVIAAGIMLPILLSIDAANLWRYRADWQRPMVFVLLPAAVVGIAIGTMTFQFLSQDWIRFGLGVLTLSFVVHRLLLPSGSAGSRFSRGWRSVEMDHHRCQSGAHHQRRPPAAQFKPYRLQDPASR